MTGHWTGMSGLEGLKPAQDPAFDPQGLEVSLKGFKQGSDEGLPHCRKLG